MVVRIWRKEQFADRSLRPELYGLLGWCRGEDQIAERAERKSERTFTLR